MHTTTRTVEKIGWICGREEKERLFRTLGGDFFFSSTGGGPFAFVAIFVVVVVKAAPISSNQTCPLSQSLWEVVLQMGCRLTQPPAPPSP